MKIAFELNLDKKSLMTYSVKATKIIRQRSLVLILIVAIIFLVLAGVPQRIFEAASLFSDENSITNKIDSLEDSKRKSLEVAYRKLKELEKVRDFQGMYNFLTPSAKTTISLNQFVSQRNSIPQNYYQSQNYTINSIEIRSNVGIVDRTVTGCAKAYCLTNELYTDRSKKQFFLIDGNWYHNLDDTSYCAREQPYTNPPEFDRAFSLIIQRMTQNGDAYAKNRAKEFQAMKNCLDIKYAQSDQEINGAEGVFSFSENSSDDQLKILVSPRYQVKDDLLTAALLSHELYHALIFILDKTGTTCYPNEAGAFVTEMGFLKSLSEEEVASITYRYNNRTSPEAVGVIDLIVGLAKSPGATPFEKALNYVKNVPFYQKQCREN